MIEITLFWPDKRLSPNSRVHWGEMADARRNAKENAWWETYDAVVGEIHPKRFDEYVVQYKFYPPDRRKRDIDNCLAMMKSAQDGVCSYLDIDDSRIKRTVLEWGEVVKGGKVVLRLEEME